MSRWGYSPCERVRWTGSLLGLPLTLVIAPLVVASLVVAPVVVAPDALAAASPAEPVTSGAASGVGSTAAEPTPIPPVDWPELPNLAVRHPALATKHFEVHALDPNDEFLLGLVEEWGPQLEGILQHMAARLGRSLPRPPVRVAFARAYPARCPARGLASTGHDGPLLMVYADETTDAVQVRAVLAHEIVHHLTSDDGFVGDGVLSEGIANYGAGELMLAWQGYPAWDEAVLDYLAEGNYVSITDPHGLSPDPGEDCIARRDRVYNTRTAFVSWLVESVGLETVLAMPFVLVADRDTATGEVLLDSETGQPRMVRRPDYRAATGHDLATLELLWLTQLWTER